MKRSGEDFIQTKNGELPEIREAAKKLSSSKNHSWANIYYIDSESKKLTSETYTEGKMYSINRDQLTFPGDNWWNLKLTVLEAMVKYSDFYIAKNAKRILKNRGLFLTSGKG